MALFVFKQLYLFRVNSLCNFQPYGLVPWGGARGQNLVYLSFVLFVFSSSEPKAHRWAYRIPMVRRPSTSVHIRRCRPFTISNISFETAWSIKATFHVEPPWEGGTKVYINGLGHITKMAARPIYGKNLKQSSSPEQKVI